MRLEVLGGEGRGKGPQGVGPCLQAVGLQSIQARLVGSMSCSPRLSQLMHSCSCTPAAMLSPAMPAPGAVYACSKTTCAAHSFLLAWLLMSVYTLTAAAAL